MKSASFKWDPSLETGFEPIDREHKAFLGKLVHFLKACENGASPKDILENLVFLRSYAAEHIAHEEALMDAIAFKHAASHKKIHAAFRDRVEELTGNIDRYRLQSNAILASVFTMSDWFIKHIRGDDAILARDVKEAISGDQETKAKVEKLTGASEH